MLTLTHLKNTSIRCSGGPMAIVSYPEKPVAGSLSLLSAPQEFPSREVVSWPGEYDVAGITVRGIGHLDGRAVSYLVEVDGVRIAFPFSPLAAWSDTEIEHLGDVHVLVLPAEDPKVCQTLLDEIDPRILIITPAHDGSMNQEMLKACGAVGKEHVAEYKLKGSFPQEGREVVVFGE